MHSPDIEELTEPDTPPSSQNRPKLIRRALPTAVDVDVQTYRTVVSEPPTSNVGLVEQGQGLGAPSGTPLPTSFGPLVLPKGPEFVATPQPKVGLDLGQALYTAGTRPVGPQVTTVGHLSTPHLPVGMAIQPAQVNPSLVPPLVPMSAVSSTLSTSVVPAYTVLTPSISIATAMPLSSVVADTRPTYVSLGAPLTSAPPLVSATAVPSVVMYPRCSIGTAYLKVAQLYHS